MRNKKVKKSKPRHPPPCTHTPSASQGLWGNATLNPCHLPTHPQGIITHPYFRRRNLAKTIAFLHNIKSQCLRVYKTAPQQSATIPPRNKHNSHSPEFVLPAFTDASKPISPGRPSCLPASSSCAPWLAIQQLKPDLLICLAWVKRNEKPENLWIKRQYKHLRDQTIPSSLHKTKKCR